MSLFKLLLCCSMLAASLSEDFHPDRTRLIDYYPRIGPPTNILFRGNMPAINGTFAYKELLQAMSAAAALANISLPPNLIIIDVSYMNVFEEQDLKIEKDFFSSNPNLGQFHNRVITGALFPPPQDDTNLIKDTVKLYEEMSFDKLSDVTAMLYKFLNSTKGPAAIYTHCEAGVDRTGEVSGAYYMKYLNMTFAQAFKINHNVESRDMYKESSNAMQWYCFYLKFVEGLSSVGDCLLPATS